MADTIYNVLAAKFSSESADGVGKETFFIVQKYGSIAFTSQGHLKRAMRQLWDDKGRPRIPPEAAQIVEGAQIDFWYSPKKKPRAKESEDKPGI